MNGPYQRVHAPSAFPAVRAIVLVTVVAFVVQQLGDFRAHGGITMALGLSRDGVLGHGWVWQLVTYMLLHAGFLHILMNMVVLYSFGRDLEAMIGTLRFALLYVASGIVGGIGWLVLSGSGAGLCIGASGAVFGVAAAFAAVDPDRQLSLMIFPIPVPITMKARTMVLAYGACTVLLLLGNFGNIAHAAHLSGGLCGYWYGRRIRSQAPRAPWPPAAPEDAALDPVDVDRILEKIKAEGLGSLTRQERDMLDRASRR
ncbi:MAG: rhomboid family intramembrane serine protease [Lentisphaerae bacterium]|nr:rhomboid family intramembrane serine protease [Lentisphaerota bacterium]